MKNMRLVIVANLLVVTVLFTLWVLGVFSPEILATSGGKAFALILGIGTLMSLSYMVLSGQMTGRSEITTSEGKSQETDTMNSGPQFRK